MLKNILQAETGRWTALCETSPMSSSQETELQDLALPRGPPQTKQSIVPQLLIDHYVSMIDPSRAQTVDHEIAMSCCSLRVACMSAMLCFGFASNSFFTASLSCLGNLVTSPRT